MAGFAVDDQLSGPVGARARHRRDARPLRGRPGPRRPVQRDGGRATTSSRPTTPGWVRDRLAQTLGGTAVIAMGTLGRQEGDRRRRRPTPRSPKQGRFMTNALMRALTQARRITDTTLAAATQPFSTTAENMGLLAAMSCNDLGRPARLPRSAHGACRQQRGRHVGLARRRQDLHGQPLARGAVLHGPPPDDRDVEPPSPASAISCSRPPRARRSPRSPRRSSACSRTTDGIRGVHIIDHAGDQLGYYWDARRGRVPAGPDPPRATSPSTTSASPGPGQCRRDPRRRRGARPVSDGSARHPQQKDDPNAFSKPTIQFYPNRTESHDPAVSFYGTSKKAQAAGSGAARPLS